jgi:hypothetical protein
MRKQPRCNRFRQSLPPNPAPLAGHS